MPIPRSFFGYSVGRNTIIKTSFIFYWKALSEYLFGSYLFLLIVVAKIYILLQAGRHHFFAVIRRKPIVLRLAGMGKKRAAQRILYPAQPTALSLKSFVRCLHAIAYTQLIAYVIAFTGFFTEFLADVRHIYL